VIALFQQVIVLSALHIATGIMVKNTTIVGSQLAIVAITLSGLIDVI
jgi:hypothetical protein